MRKILLAICLIALSIPTIAQIKCTITGSVIGRPESKTLILSKYGDDTRVVEPTRINIVEGRFSYVLDAPYPEMYELHFEEELFSGLFMPTSFCAENGIVEFKLHPFDERIKNRVISDGVENKAILEHGLIIKNFLFKHKSYIDRKKAFPEDKKLSVLGLELNAKLDTVTIPDSKYKLYNERHKLQMSGEFYSTEYNIIRKSVDSIRLLLSAEIEKYETENPSLFIYAEFIHDFKNGLSSSKEQVVKKYEILANAYPNHSYTARCNDLVKLFEQIRLGGKYIDFSAPDLDGNIIKLSSEIKGKVAIIDLWASWCGPCRKTSKSYIPVYNEFKDRGFTIIGVAREMNSNDMRKATRKDGYPWTNLIEINDENKIWEKYAIGNSGGSSLLVDEDGVILAIKPTAEEVRKILLERLN